MSIVTKTEDLLSIIVPVYNAENTIPRCIESILAQTYSQFELILVNDGSADKSLEICRSYEKIDSRIIVLDGPNGGVSKARNKGLDIAKGSVWGFVDSDDWIEPNHFSSLISGLKWDLNASMSVVGVVSPQWKQYMNAINSGDDYRALSYLEALDELTAKSGFRGYLWNKLFYSTVHRLNEELAVCEDLEFIIRYLIHFNNKPVVVVNACTYHYYRNRPEGHVRNQYGFKRSFSAFQAYEQSMQHLKQIGGGIYLRRIEAHIMHTAYEYLVAWYSLPSQERNNETYVRYQIPQAKIYFKENYSEGIAEAKGKEKYEFMLFDKCPHLAIKYLSVKYRLKSFICHNNL
jgi:glycosyltransferase involved in cell wall biosynthesis